MIHIFNLFANHKDRYVFVFENSRNPLTMFRFLAVNLVSMSCWQSFYFGIGLVEVMEGFSLI